MVPDLPEFHVMEFLNFFLNERPLHCFQLTLLPRTEPPVTVSGMKMGSDEETQTPQQPTAAPAKSDPNKPKIKADTRY